MTSINTNEGPVPGALSTPKQVFAEAGPLDPTDAANMCHGGPFASVELGNSGVASMNIVNDKKET